MSASEDDFAGGVDDDTVDDGDLDENEEDRLDTSEVGKFNSFLRKSLQKSRREGTFDFVSVAGVRVYKLAELESRDDYLIIEGATADVRFIVRKIKSVSSATFSASTVDNSLSIQSAKQATRLTILGFQDSIELLLGNYYTLLLKDIERKFGEQSKNAHRFGICLSFETNHVNTAVNSGIWDLNADNRDHVVSEILNLLTKTLISSSPESALEDLHIKASIIDQAPLKGDGYIRVFSPIDYIKKSYHPKLRKRACLLIAKSDKKCMFVSTYLAYTYNRLMIEADEVEDKLADLPIRAKIKIGRGKKCRLRAVLRSKRKSIRRRLLGLVNYDADEQLTLTRLFFRHVVKVDINKEEEATLSLLKKIFEATQMQVAIYCQSRQYKKMLAWPEHVNIYLPQIRLVRYAHPLVTEKSQRGKTHSFHYNATIRLNALLTCQGYSICIFCDEFKSQKRGTFSHKCADKHYPRCASCFKPKVSHEDRARIPPVNVRAIAVCVTARRPITVEDSPVDEVDDSIVDEDDDALETCTSCLVEFRSRDCRTNHTKARCRAFFTCTNCSTKVRYRGKYCRSGKEADSFPTRHVDCSEVYCLFCEDFFPHFDELGRQHVCMTRTLGAPVMPAGLIAFDIEASVGGERDTFSAVTICCVYQERRHEHDEYRAVVFSEIGTEYRGVPHGQPIRLEPDELIDDYFPYDVMMEGNPFSNRANQFYTDHRAFLEPGKARKSFSKPHRRPSDEEEKTQRVVAPGTTVIEQFVSFLLQPRFRNYTVISHYGRGFDNQFVLRECVRKSERVHPIFQGNKILSLKIVSNCLTLLDTNAHIPLSLREMAKQFGLERGKTFFPFTLLKKCNYKLKLAQLPPIENYEPLQMSKVERPEFMDWYEQHKHDPFDLEHVVVDYCMRDTTTLLSAAQLYIRSCFIVEQELWSACCNEEQMSGLKASRMPIMHNGEKLYLVNTHVFSRENCTSASFANRLFLSTTRQHVPIIDDQYANSQKYLSSQVEIDCAQYLKKTVYPNLQYALSQSKQKRLTFDDGSHVFLDMWDPDSRTPIEFYGCSYHGCRKCAKKGVRSPYRLDFDQCYEATLRREKKINSHPDVIGPVKAIWQCDFQLEIEDNAELKEFIATRPRLHFPALREGLRGGYVSCFAAHVNRETLSEQYARSSNVTLEAARKFFNIYFLDINSQYPSKCVSVNPGQAPELKTPTSAPLVLFWPATLDECGRQCCQKNPHLGECNPRLCDFVCPSHCPVEQWDRVIGCANVTILPPRNCRVPLLSVRIKHADGKEYGTQPLCYECARTYTKFHNMALCKHTDKQREIKSTVYLFEELLYAVKQQGYMITTVHSVQFYTSFVTDILKPLMSTLSKLKISNSPTPPNISLADYVGQLNRETGLNFRMLDFLSISSALRLVAKLLMNAQLGKQSQSVDRIDKRMVFCFQDYQKIVEDPSLTITYFEVLTKDCLLVHVRNDIKVTKSFSKGCLFLTCFVNMCSRIGLVRDCERLLAAGYALVYCDTDSVLFCSISPDALPIDQVLPLHGSKLGYWKVEHSDILSAVIFNKKGYAITLADLMMIIKCKGFHLIEQLLADHKRLNIMEQELGWVLAGGDTRDILLYQRQFRVNGRSFCIDMVPESASMKKLRLIGPRKYVKSVDFVTTHEITIKASEVREIRCGKRSYGECQADDDEVDIPKVVVKVAKLSGYVPYLPFGFLSDSYETSYAFVKQS